MAKIQSAKIANIEESNGKMVYQFFFKSNYWGMKHWNVKEEIDGTYFPKGKKFVANDGREFQVQNTFTAVLAN